MSLLQRILLIAILAHLPNPAFAQGDVPPAPDSLPESARFFLDCSGFHCEPDFYQTEIKFVQHVRSRQDADVHVLVTRQSTGGGGREYTLAFIGQRGHASRGEATLKWVAPPASTEDDERQGIARMLKLGLIPFVSGTTVANDLRVTYTPPTGGGGASSASRDPWDRWTFRTGLNAYFNGQSRSGSSDMFGSVSANRVTDEWKIMVSSNGSREDSRFEIDDSTTIESSQHSYGMNGLLVRSLGPHLSAGLRANGSSSTFLNQSLHVRLAPAIEYNIYPYSESTRRQLNFQYSVGANSFDYRKETIFGKTSESMLDHTALTSLELKQKWGSVSVSLQGRQFLHDLSRYQAVAFNNAELSLIKGLSLNFFGSISYVRDQLYLPIGNASSEEILLRLRQLETSYFYYGSVGISYTFGSIYNAVVNPRFNAGR